MATSLYPDPIVATDVVGLLCDLIALPSVNPQHSSELSAPFGEALVADYVEEFARTLGVRVDRQTVLSGRDNVILTLEGADPARALLFECHMDTVPGWDGVPGPFEPRVVDKLIFGRGACDVKGSLAAMLAALRAVGRSGRQPRRSLVVAAVVDEEHQARGVGHLASHGPRAEAAVVGEPTSLAIAIAHKGCVRWRIATHGRSVHSSKSHLGLNAIDAMVTLLADLKVAYEPFLLGREHQLAGRPSLSVCTIHGGVAVNVIPDRCVVEIDRRTIPGESLAEVRNDFESMVRDIALRRGLEVEIEPPFVSDPALGTPPSEEIVRDLSLASQQVRGESQIIGVPFGTDGSKLSEVGIPTVVFGPGTIDLAHTRDESVPIQEVVQAANILYALASRT